MPTKINKPAKRYWDLERHVTSDNKAVADLYLYGLICEDKYSESDVTAYEIAKELQSLGAVDEINVRIFSNGGDVWAGLAIYELLKQRSEKVIGFIDGIAASIATVISQACDELYISKTAMFMVHRPMVWMLGLYNQHDMTKYIAELERVSSVLITAYADRTGKAPEEIYALLDANNGDGTYLNAAEAVALGFADAITPDTKAPLDMVAMVRPNVYMARGREIDMSVYNNAPQLAISGSRAQKGKVKMARGKVVNKNGKFKAELATLECPFCRTVLDIDTANGIVTLRPEESATVAVPMEVEAKRIGKNYQNELFKITCPECGGEFEHGVDSGAGSEVTPDEGAAKAPLPTQAKRRGNVKASRKTVRRRMQGDGEQSLPEAETVPVDITCTECGYDFSVDVDPAISEAVTNCPNCQAELTVDTSSAGDDGGVDAPPADDIVIAAYRRGITAERRRQNVLDERGESFPQFADAIANFKKNGTSIECANNWIFTAMGANPANRSGNVENAAHQQWRNSARKDARVLSKLGHPAGGNSKADETAALADNLSAMRGTKKHV